MLLVEVARELRHDRARAGRVDERAHLEAVARVDLGLVPQPVAVAHAAAVHLGARADEADVRDEQEARAARRALALG